MSENDLPLYPLRFKPIYKQKVWGGRRLDVSGRQLPGDSSMRIGESWELVDLGQTSSTGCGDAERSEVANGPLAGVTLHEVMHRFGPRLMGNLTPTKAGDFPLLVKYLDAAENLSLQVHPSPAYAEEHREAHLKSEAWYIIEAEPDAVIYKGVQPGVQPAQFRDAIASGDVESVVAMMATTPAKPGDCHYLPSGTCHALGAGVLVAEVQTPSDTTFRVFDWGRTGRELHVEQAMQCIEFGPLDVESYEKRSHVAGIFTTLSRLITCEHFRIEKVRMSEGYEQEMPYNQPAVWMVLEGGGRIAPGNGAEDVTFERGDTMLVPADMNDAKVALTRDTVWLDITFPQAMPQQIA